MQTSIELDLSKNLRSSPAIDEIEVTFSGRFEDIGHRRLEVKLNIGM
jgi:hypothetical protein